MQMYNQFAFKALELLAGYALKSLKAQEWGGENNQFSVKIVKIHRALTEFEKLK